MTQCPECGARYSADTDSCAVRFEQLLALDHSRQEPWGSRHGQAFAVFALQHPIRYAASLDHAWEALCRIYVLRQPPADVFRSMRARDNQRSRSAHIPPRPPKPVRAHTTTIADLGEFPAGEYAAALDGWCRATIRAWGVSIAVEAP